jgi:hypothetical protein
LFLECHFSTSTDFDLGSVLSPASLMFYLTDVLVKLKGFSRVLHLHIRIGLKDLARAVLVGLKGHLRVMPLLVSPLLGVCIGLKSLVKVMSILLFGAYIALCSPFLNFCSKFKEQGH